MVPPATFSPATLEPYFQSGKNSSRIHAAMKMKRKTRLLNASVVSSSRYRDREQIDLLYMLISWPQRARHRDAKGWCLLRWRSRR